MCGIAGYILNQKRQVNPESFERWFSMIRRRGPDDEGAALLSRRDKQCRLFRTQRTHPKLSNHESIDSTRDMAHDVAFLHTRYAILDLSENGHQPFVSQDENITLIFNGEIYNYLEIRRELVALGVNFRTSCDTEVLVEGYVRWKEGLFEKLNGFWAIVLHDRRDDSIILSRDRMGVAPLYTRETHHGLFFASFIEPLLEIDGVKATINSDVEMGFLQTGFKDIAGTTYYKEIHTLPASTIIKLGSGQTSIASAIHQKYWSLPLERFHESEISFEKAVNSFREIFFNAVEIRLRSDVKLAFELSGGLDSSSVVAAAAIQDKNQITTYTAKVQGADEEPYARAMLKMYKLDFKVINHVEDVFAQDYLKFSRLMEEPYDNPNAYTHYQMLKLMRQDGVKVVVTGAGGDETLAGYEASFWPGAYRQWRKTNLWQADCYEFFRRYRTLKNTSTTFKSYLAAPINRWIKVRQQQPIPPTHLTTAQNYEIKYPTLTFDEQRRFHFEIALLPYYMRSSDHFTMGIPIEHRFPLLDYRLVEFGLKLPISYLFRNGWTKYILRKAMEPFLPSKILWRREKMGFRFPYTQYFSKHRNVFEPLVGKRYEALLKSDPMGLWRCLSTEMWRRNNHI